MTFIFGVIFVLVCVLGAYAFHGGHLDVLWQPAEFVIIFGASIGAMIIANPSHVLKDVCKSMGPVIKGPRFKKKDFIDLLIMLYVLFKQAKFKGMLALESHVDNPHQSSIFSINPVFLHDHHALDFLCDYLRIITMGVDNVFQLEDLMDHELELLAHETAHPHHALQTMSDGMPAMGIVAAVLGVIHTMGSIDQPPSVLGHLIGAALVGTFSGILMSYGFASPYASALKTVVDTEHQYYLCLKSALISFVQGHNPANSIEFARKSIDAHYRPSFEELQKAISEAPSIS